MDNSLNTSLSGFLVPSNGRRIPATVTLDNRGNFVFTPTEPVDEKIVTVIETGTRLCVALDK